MSFYDGDMARLFENVAICKPTWLSGVPRVWAELHAKYSDAVSHKKQYREQPETEW